MLKPPSQSTNQVRPMLFAVFLVLFSLEVIDSRSLVKTLPGFDGDLPFTLETGYIGLGESDEVQLFYYFIESEGNPKDDPLMLWMSGGPGCSSASGLFYEIGPLTFPYATSTLEKPVLELVPDSWTKVASIIFLDQPAGSGFSYARTPEAYITNDTSAAINSYNFLRKWLIEHPKFLNNPLYIGADSYSGIVLPIIVEEIYNGNEVGKLPHLNFKRYVLGNPLTDTNGGTNSRMPFAHRMALLSDAIYKSTKENCHGDYVNVDPDNNLCKHDLQVVNKCLERIFTSQILEPTCDLLQMSSNLTPPGGLTAVDKTFLDNWSLAEFRCKGADIILFLSLVLTLCVLSFTTILLPPTRPIVIKDVREALHIREEFGHIEWVRCNETFSSKHKEAISYTHNVVSSVDYHRRLLDKTCRALIYSGDHDMIVPYVGTLSWIESLNLPVVDDWRPWFVDKQVAGYTMKYLNDNYSLTFASVKGGGHTAPSYKPKECLSMFMRWLADDTL
ncbi:serine carboxypeptidase [Artemisia annua]|uniref:Serine carboxypeptidase n=1 Tax=Artemisia annua TaxID=35608 RepID=A0A2U1P833_ARTAN|nr:serine carboxypeptidase [Artemisia annua]